MKNFEEIKIRLQQFASERDWDQFHSPKNLVMALSGEVGELAECFQWLTEAQSKNLSGNELEKVKEEIADVQIYLIRLADKLGIDLLSVASDKINKNETKYPVDQVRGSAKKYTEYKTVDKK